MILLPAHNASEWTGPTGNNTYLLNGLVPTLVDAGVGHPAHVEAIAQALGGRPLAQVLVTHGHPDHVAGIPALAKRWPGLRVLDAAALGGRQSIEAGDRHLRVIATPGHAPDHVCFMDDEAGDLYCGDLARLGGTIVIPASKGGSLRVYLESLARVRELGPRRLLPGHGPIIDDPASLIDEYNRHRLDRERQVIAARAEGLSTPEAIARRIYGELSSALFPAAVDTVRAHLDKIRDDGAR